MAQEHRITTKDQASARRHGLPAPALGSVQVPALTIPRSGTALGESQAVKFVPTYAMETTGGKAADLSALIARIAALETLLSGLSRQTVTYCTGGSSSSKTILMS
jgi:hypothetical protein